MELFDRHRCLVELVMKQKTQEDKDGVIRQIINAAENGHSQLRTILTAKVFRYPNPNRKYFFWKCHRQCETIAQMADAYSWNTWGCSIKEALVHNNK